MSAAWRRTSSVCAGRGRAGRLGGALEPAPKAPGKRHEAAPISAGGRGLEPRYPGPRPGGLTSCPIPQGVSNLAIRDAIRFHKLSDTAANMCSYIPRAAPFTEGQLRVAIEKALCGSDVLRHLGYGVKGDNYRTLQRWAQRARHALRRNTPRVRSCAGCGEIFSPRGPRHRYCSQKCWGKIAADTYKGVAHPEGASGLMGGRMVRS